MPALVLYLRPNTQRPAVIDDLLGLAEAGQQEAVDTAILMLTDLYLNGHASAYAKKLKGVPVWELKSHARGGAKGGMRVYFYFRRDGSAHIVSAESKPGDAPGPAFREAVAVAATDHQRS
ncbi:hypothetical protein RDMS_09810 [Deinococcus sp. RL]|uniref:hypothetical protein n=1 Tax=Deinococcus sp. RL TaxID=1489678 RepID=UPI0004D8296F|nr:hypothetical protein [Deinococcus sp. RL]KEF33978.1 hypothetical protein RDMS_09810 [Deinococcus sp. RL]